MKNCLFRRLFRTTILAFVILFFLFPVIYVILLTFSSISYYYGDGSFSFTLSNLAVIQNEAFVKSLMTSLFISLIGAILSLVITVMGGYAFFLYYPFNSKGLCKEAGVIKNLFLFTMVFNGGLIPFYMLVKFLGLMNSYGALIVPYLFHNMLIFFCCEEFRKMSPSLLELARLEGYGEGELLVKIVLPMKKNLLLSLLTLHFIFHWNNWYPGVLFLHQSDQFPVQVFLRKILFSDSRLQNLGFYQECISQPEKMTYVFLSVIPIMVAFVLLTIFTKNNRHKEVQ